MIYPMPKRPCALTQGEQEWRYQHEGYVAPTKDASVTLSYYPSGWSGVVFTTGGYGWDSCGPFVVVVHGTDKMRVHPTQVRAVTGTGGASPRP
jgi:hypothetical protein